MSDKPESTLAWLDRRAATCADMATICHPSAQEYAASATRYRSHAEYIRKLESVLRSAARYVQGYAENDGNHPQARDGARSLLADINSTIT